VEAAANELETPIRVLIADDHRLFAEALELSLELEPDVVLMDISMPVMDGIESTRRIRESRPNACVVMLTGSSSAADVDRSRDAGAAGYVTKDRIASELLEAIVDAAGR
jgi:two-component system nitrate/nitrite response regulator NarL